MKNGKRPTRNQKMLMREYGLNPLNWLVVKNLGDVLEIAHRDTGITRTIAKGPKRVNYA